MAPFGALTSVCFVLFAKNAPLRNGTSRVLIQLKLSFINGETRRQAASKPPQPETRTPHVPEAPEVTVTATIVRRLQATVAPLFSPHDTS